MVISKIWNGTLNRYEWTKGLVAGAEPFIALEDALEKSVRASSRLPGLSCSGQFTLQTGYYDSVVAPTGVTDGAYVSAYANGHAQAGEVKIAATGDRIIGQVTDGHHAGLADQSAVNSNAVDCKVITFITTFAGAVAP
jgi:hypothetical protein